MRKTNKVSWKFSTVGTHISFWTGHKVLCECSPYVNYVWGESNNCLGSQAQLQSSCNQETNVVIFSAFHFQLAVKIKTSISPSIHFLIRWSSQGSWNVREPIPAALLLKSMSLTVPPPQKKVTLNVIRMVHEVYLNSASSTVLHHILSKALCEAWNSPFFFLTYGVYIRTHVQAAKLPCCGLPLRRCEASNQVTKTNVLINCPVGSQHLAVEFNVL